MVFVTFDWCLVDFPMVPISFLEIKLFIGSDELIYQDIEDLRMAAHIGNPKITRFEDSVFTGKYCAGKISEEYLSQLEENRSSKE